MNIIVFATHDTHITAQYVFMYMHPVFFPDAHYSKSPVLINSKPLVEGDKGYLLKCNFLWTMLLLD